MNVADVIDLVRRDVAMPTQVLEDGRTVVLPDPAASRTLVLEIGDDAVRVSVGRIVHAEVCEEPADVSNVTAIIRALVSGGAKELFGTSPLGVSGYIGYSIATPETNILRLDEGAVVTHSADL